MHPDFFGIARRTIDPAEKLIAIQMIQVPLAEGSAYRQVFRELVYAALTGQELGHPLRSRRTDGVCNAIPDGRVDGTIG